MRELISVDVVGEDEIIAVMTDNTVWFGAVVYADDKHFIEWEPLNAPPDGEFWAKSRKGLWDRLEDSIREKHARIAESEREDVSVETTEEVVAGTGGAATGVPSDSDQ